MIPNILPKFQARKNPVYASIVMRACVLLCILTTVLMASHTDNYLRYAVYFFPVIVAMEWLLRPSARLTLGDSPFLPVIGMVVALIYPACTGVGNGWSLFIFMLLPYLALLVAVRIPFSTIFHLFILLSLGQVALTLQGDFSFDKLKQISLSAHTFTETTHTIPFVLGLAMAPLLREKKYLAFGIGLLMLVLGEKRIAIIGAILGAIVYLAAKHLLAKDAGRVTKWPVYIIILGVFIFNLYLPDVMEWYAYSRGLNVNIFTSGRLTFQEEIYKHVFNRDIIDTLFGSGLGVSDASAIRHGGIPMIHDDYLRLTEDIGIVQTSIFMLSFITIVARSSLFFYLIPYVATVWMTDNTISYAFYGSVLVLVLMESGVAVIKKKDQSNRTCPPYRKQLIKQLN